MNRRCHKEAELKTRIRTGLGIDVGDVTCHIVDEPGMAAVMGTAGWSRNDARGVIGFQVGRKIHVLDSTPWTVLHELVHTSGVNADRLNRFVAEGLTECIAGALSRGTDEHQPTYPEATAWVKGTLLPKLKTDALTLGREIARASNPPRYLAERLAGVDSTLDARRLERELQPQLEARPQLGSRAALGKRTRRCALGHCPVAIGGTGRVVRHAATDDRVEKVFAVLAVVTVVLGVSVAAKRRA